MVKVVLLLLYLLRGNIHFEREAFDSMEACVAAGKARAATLVKHPEFDEGLYANCIPQAVTEVKASE